ncbi:MAG: 3-methyl-2-oxobutanoate dehydrogenase subunit VorB [Lentisphaerae bacterium GWF2_52_8]|nr:MAG: 3-methyl-2-oxobutanoate dehydrogenase subunit VorB [Lentisphaerae bacterium GWF2_52_8]
MEYDNRLLLKGNEATVYGALLAGCDCFFGYPITPASEIAHSAALLFPRLNRVFMQAESEIAAINMVFGASAAGRRAMTASSGLGISLKQEGMSYLATCELPAVVVDIMRGGPGLGNIGPEQGDYNQVVKGGGHGNYKCIVLAPNSSQEMCDLTSKAFDLADLYRIPVYVLTDGVIGQMLEPVTLPEPIAKKTFPEWSFDGTNASRRNFLTSIYLDHDDLEAVNIRLQEKYARIAGCEQQAELYQTEDAEIVIVGYGIVSRIARSAVMELRAQGVKAGLLRPVTLFPFPVDSLRKVAKTAKSLLCVEMSNGQMVDDVRLATEFSLPIHLYTRMGGNVPSVREITQKCLDILAQAGKGSQVRI